MGFDADSIGHDFYRLVIGNVRNIINELFYILQFEREFFQLSPCIAISFAFSLRA